MNITDFEAPETPATWAEALDAIFQRQTALMAKYKEIEQLPEPPISLHHAAGQRILKDFAWRSVEELAESFEAFEKHEVHEVARLHGLEEVADALHFLVELLIFAGITAEQCLEQVPDWPAELQEGTTTPLFYYWQATYRLGLSMNFLRNKPWKQSQVPTDEARFRSALLSAFSAHVHVWVGLKQDWVDMFNFYFRKSEVNKFRQRSNY